MSRTLNGSIELTKYKSVIQLKKTKSGEEKRVLILDISGNFFTDKDNRVFAPVTVFLNDEPDKYDNIASIKQGVSSEVYKAADVTQKEEFKKLPYLGNLKDFKNTPSSEPAEVVGENEDLPF